MVVWSIIWHSFWYFFCRLCVNLRATNQCWTKITPTIWSFSERNPNPWQQEPRNSLGTPLDSKSTYTVFRWGRKSPDFLKSSIQMNIYRQILLHISWHSTKSLCWLLPLIACCLFTFVNCCYCYLRCIVLCSLWYCFNNDCLSLSIPINIYSFI